MREARRRVEQGQPEMVMTGISVGGYRDPEALEAPELGGDARFVDNANRMKNLAALESALAPHFAKRSAADPHEHPGRRARNRRSIDRHRNRSGGGDSCGGRVQSFLQPDPCARSRDGKFLL